MRKFAIAIIAAFMVGCGDSEPTTEGTTKVSFSSPCEEANYRFDQLTQEAREFFKNRAIRWYPDTTFGYKSIIQIEKMNIDVHCKDQ